MCAYCLAFLRIQCSRMLDTAPAWKRIKLILSILLIKEPTNLHIQDIMIPWAIDFTHLVVDQQSEQSFACMYGVAKMGIRRSSFHIRVVQSAQDMKYLGWKGLRSRPQIAPWWPAVHAYMSAPCHLSASSVEATCTHFCMDWLHTSTERWPR